MALLANGPFVTVGNFAKGSNVMQSHSAVTEDSFSVTQMLNCVIKNRILALLNKYNIPIPASGSKNTTEGTAHHKHTFPSLMHDALSSRGFEFCYEGEYERNMEHDFDRLAVYELPVELFVGNYRLTGTIDLVLFVEGIPVEIIDFKTTGLPLTAASKKQSELTAEELYLAEFESNSNFSAGGWSFYKPIKYEHQLVIYKYILDSTRNSDVAKGIVWYSLGESKKNRNLYGGPDELDQNSTYQQMYSDVDAKYLINEFIHIKTKAENTHSFKLSDIENYYFPARGHNCMYCTTVQLCPFAKLIMELSDVDLFVREAASSKKKDKIFVFKNLVLAMKKRHMVKYVHRTKLFESQPQENWRSVFGDNQPNELIVF